MSPAGDAGARGADGIDAAGAVVPVGGGLLLLGSGLWAHASWPRRRS